MFFLTTKIQDLEEINVKPLAPQSQTELLKLTANRNS